MISSRIVALLSLSALSALVTPLRAELKLAGVFGSHMVLQRGEPIPIWGWAESGEEITVAVGEKKATTKAGEGGKWMVRLPAMDAGGPHTITVTGSKGGSAKLEDVLVGEVWLCSGQSNMEWTVAGSNDAQQEIASGEHPKIRHLKVPHRPSDKPEADVATGGWKPASPKTVGDFTAVGYFFARHLQKELDVPIGLIGSNWGGTRIEPWTPPEGFKAVPALKETADHLDRFPVKNAKEEIDFQTALALYNGMIHPLVPYGIRGALWYQGESNNGEGMLYFEKMKALIAGWRAVWSKPDLAFYFVQLAPYKYGDNPTPLAGIWEAQTATLKIPNTGMAVTVDVSDIKDIHPRNKQDVGKRLALWALAKNYGKRVVYSGPLYKGMKVEGEKIRLSFEYVAGGLAARDGKPLTWFAIAGEDKKFVEAKAEIDGDNVVVSSEAVKSPVAVRFGWHHEAEPNLSNKEGLPASPFRTDSW